MKNVFAAATIVCFMCSSAYADCSLGSCGLNKVVSAGKVAVTSTVDVVRSVVSVPVRATKAVVTNVGNRRAARLARRCR